MRSALPSLVPLLAGMLLLLASLEPRQTDGQTIPQRPPPPAARTAPADGPAKADSRATTPAPSSAAPAKTNPAVDAADRRAKAAGMLDINTASEEDLKTLPGVGDAYAKRIVSGRPYANRVQLVSRKVLPKATYDKIKDKLVASQPRP